MGSFIYIIYKDYLFILSSSRSSLSMICGSSHSSCIPSIQESDFWGTREGGPASPSAFSARSILDSAVSSFQTSRGQRGKRERLGTRLEGDAYRKWLIKRRYSNKRRSRINATPLIWVFTNKKRPTFQLRRLIYKRYQNHIAREIRPRPTLSIYSPQLTRSWNKRRTFNRKNEMSAAALNQ